MIVWTAVESRWQARRIALVPKDSPVGTPMPPRAKFQQLLWLEVAKVDSLGKEAFALEK